MKEINKISVIVLIIINLILSMLTYYYFKSNKTIIQTITTEKAIKLNTLEQIFEDNLTNDNTSFIDSLSFVDVSKKSYTLGEVLTDSTTFVLRISDLHCEDCVRFMLLKLIRLTQDSNMKNNVILFASYQNKRRLSLLLDNLSVKYPVYFVGRVPLSVEELSYPYCFVLNKDGYVSHTFVPDKNQPQMANYYLETLMRRYYDK